MMIDTCTASTPQLLLIEDDPISRHLLQDMMDRLERPLVAAASGPEALALCRRQDFGLILMDLHMPGMDGYATRRHLLDLLAGKAIPPMFCLTADTRPETRIRLRREGFSEYLYKPLDLARLEALLNRYLPLAADRAREPASMDMAPQLRAELHALLVDSLPGEYRRLCQARDRGDRDTLSRIAHGLAGNAAICGVSTLSRAAMKLERSLRSGPPERGLASVDLLLRLIGPLLERREPRP